MRPVHTRPFHFKSCFCMKDNITGVGFQLRRPPANQQCLGSKRQPGPSLPNLEKMDRGKKASVAFLNKETFGLCFVP